MNSVRNSFVQDTLGPQSSQSRICTDQDVERLDKHASLSKPVDSEAFVFSFFFYYYGTSLASLRTHIKNKTSCVTKRLEEAPTILGKPSYFNTMMEARKVFQDYREDHLRDVAGDLMPMQCLLAGC